MKDQPSQPWQQKYCNFFLDNRDKVGYNYNNKEIVYKMFDERELLDKHVAPDSELKEYIVDYVGQKLNPADNRVTVEMVIAVLSEDFPDIILALAEENFIRGYQQGINDSSDKF